MLTLIVVLCALTLVVVLSLCVDPHRRVIVVLASPAVGQPAAAVGLLTLVVLLCSQVDNKTLQSQHGSVASQNALLQQRHMSLECDHGEVCATRDDLQSAHDSLAADHDALQLLHHQLTAEYDALVTQHATLKATYKSMKNEYRELQEQQVGRCIYSIYLVDFG